MLDRVASGEGVVLGTRDHLKRDQQVDISENKTSVDFSYWKSCVFRASFPRAMAPPADKDRRPGTQIKFAFFAPSSLPLHEVLGSSAFSFKPFPNAVSTLQEMFPNVWQTQTFAGGTNWREIRLLIQEPETASDLKM